MDYVEAPVSPNLRSLFLAGGITGCPDWQSRMAWLLKDTNLRVFNPRRSFFDVSDPSASDRQIRWEYDHLRRADAISFWFCAETLCPIVLFELGAHLADPKPIFVGCHPEYARKSDVVIQSRMLRPGLQVVESIEGLAGQIRDWARVPDGY